MSEKSSRSRGQQQVGARNAGAQGSSQTRKGRESRQEDGARQKVNS